METTIIDPHGDLKLQVENESLLVSSRVLALVSPVFEAMLKPNFQEGIAFQMGKGEPLTIPLHEDDMEALTLFCKAIHHTLNGFSERPNSLCLEKLAVICDKYQCTGPMEVYGTFWLQMQPRQIEELSSEDIGRLLLFAYILDLPRDFSTLAAELLDREKWFFDKLPGVADHPLIRHDLPGALNIAKLKMTLTLQRAVMKPIAELVTSTCGNAQGGVIEYQRCLKKFRISPYEGGFHRQSFRTIAASALRLPAIYVNPCTKPSCSCPQVSGTNLRTKLEEEIKFWKASEVHFCLDCFNGLKPANCRVCLYGSLL